MCYYRIVTFRCFHELKIPLAECRDWPVLLDDTRTCLEGIYPFRPIMISILCWECYSAIKGTTVTEGEMGYWKSRVVELADLLL